MKQRWIRRIALVAVLLTLWGVPALAQELAPERILDTLADTALKKSQTPGMAAAVVTSDGVLLKSYGLADREAERPVTDDTLFELGSMSKAFTGLGILLLEQ